MGNRMPDSLLGARKLADGCRAWTGYMGRMLGSTGFRIEDFGFGV